MGRKVSDEFTVPPCRGHHRELHRSGDEEAWWKSLGHRSGTGGACALARKPSVASDRERHSRPANSALLAAVIAKTSFWLVVAPNLAPGIKPQSQNAPPAEPAARSEASDLCRLVEGIVAEREEDDVVVRMQTGIGRRRGLSRGPV